MKVEPTTTDPDRFFQFPQPGSQEWWYFDAISDDGRDALVIVWYASLPFDPSYGVAAIRHRRDPNRHPAPVPLDHCAIGLSWYRDGKTIAYALNGFRRADFAYQPDPFSVDIAGNVLSRDSIGYHLHVNTPSVNGKTRIHAELHFEPATGTVPVECDLAQSGSSPHVWVLASADNRVEGRVSIEGRNACHDLSFRGRGYHDHNAGAEEISLAMKRWAWGRVHFNEATHVYYRAEAHDGSSHGVWIICEQGEPALVRRLETISEEGRAGNVFGVRHGRSVKVRHDGDWLRDHRSTCVDDGPFYRRWVSRFERHDGESASGISELLDTRNLNRALFNWMIPYRLKRPKG